MRQLCWTETSMALLHARRARLGRLNQHGSLRRLVAARHMRVLSCAKAKPPGAFQRSVLFIHSTVIQGCGVGPGSVNGHPGIVNVSDGRTRKSPDTFTIPGCPFTLRSEEHTSELQSLAYLVCRLLL